MAIKFSTTSMVPPSLLHNIFPLLPYLQFLFLIPAYPSWFEIDQLLLSILISTISDTLVSSIVGLTSSRAVWATLEKMFSSQSRARLMHTRYQLTTLKKGNLFIADFTKKPSNILTYLLPLANPSLIMISSSTFLVVF